MTTTKQFLEDLEYAISVNPEKELISLLFSCVKSVGKQQRPMTNHDWAVALRQYCVVRQADARRYGEIKK